MKEATIPGNSIISTIETMKSLGSIGNKVLSEYGIDQIDPDGQYPFKIRKSIHDAALSRFGNEALKYFGFSVMEYYPDWIQMLKGFLNKSTLNYKILNKTNHTNILKKYLYFHTKQGDQMLKSGVLGGTGNYGAKIFQISPLKFEIHQTMAIPLNHRAFLEGLMLGNHIYINSKIWIMNLKYDSSKSQEGIDWSKMVHVYEFKFRNVEESIDKMIASTKIFLNENLIKKVLQDADIQKNEADKQRIEAFKQKEKSELKKREVEQLSLKLGKYLPPQIHNALFSGSHDTRISTKRKKLTVFFSDIKSFTQISETLQPEALTKFLNEYFSEMTSIALSFGGTIDKYIGDAMMVFFGDPGTKGEKEDVISCVRMALKMQEKMIILQKDWKERGFDNPFRIRMGINTGYCNVGNFGSDQRLTYTIIGGEVNVAQRLESNADVGGILISNETFSYVKNIIEVEEKSSFRMKGIDRNIKAFKILGYKDKPNKLNYSRNLKNVLEHIKKINSDNLTDEERELTFKEFDLAMKKKL